MSDPWYLSVFAVVANIKLQFQFRFCPALAKKPQRDGPPKKATKKVDPFENPMADLLIGSIPRQSPSHILVLNKYPIIPNHFILATKSNKQQTHILEEDDVAMTYDCLKEWSPGRLFAFFNSGEHSGASQAHRHVQFLPVEDIKRDVHDETWSLLIDKITEQTISTAIGTLILNSCLVHSLLLLLTNAGEPRAGNRDMPFTYFSSRLPSNPSSKELYNIYTKLYEASAMAIEHFIEQNPDQLELHSTVEGALPISYNMGMTKECMVICPRKREGKMIQRDDGSDIDFVALNGTVLAGTLMVKNEELWHLVSRDPKRLDEVLQAIGISVDSSSQSSNVETRL